MATLVLLDMALSTCANGAMPGRRLRRTVRA